MAMQMTNSQLIEQIAPKNELAKKDVKGVATYDKHPRLPWTSCVAAQLRVAPCRASCDPDAVN
jgi:hypothetical protein